MDALKHLKWLLPKLRVPADRDSVIAMAARELPWQQRDIGYAVLTNYEIGQRHGPLIEACENHRLCTYRRSHSFHGGVAVLAATDEALVSSIRREIGFGRVCTEE